MGFLKNERGQMAVFVALFFQVLFVFFAMAINVGLVVHDKINLQNSVDLAAYYGAMKQAEVLNQIAHINYQMRQNYKLFVWRYRVLGTLGNRNHPLYLHNYWPDGNVRTLYPDEPSWVPGGPPEDQVMPSICVSHSFFQETIDLDESAASVCQFSDFALPALGTVSGVAGFVPSSSALPGLRDYLASELAKFCKEAGIYNFIFASRILASFRVDGVVRKTMIDQLAKNLSLETPLDVRNESIREAVETTLRKNLTESNRNGLGDVQYLNSLSLGQCANSQFWLPEILINPAIFYMDWNADSPTSGRCPSASMKANRGADNLPYGFADAAFGGWVAPTETLQRHWAGEPIGSEYHSSVGFEKNPWCMVYTGVSVTSNVRKLFAPGGSIQLRARGFAKPFGGRIGPWYGQTWDSGNPTSVSTNRSLMVDPQLPSRNVSGGGPAPDPNKDVANYSRFPGDRYGMGSKEAMSAMIRPFMDTMQHRSNTDTPAIAIANYDELSGIDKLRTSGDPLARYGSTREQPDIFPKHRQFELAATAPDVFDALYYSIEPAYYDNYFRANTTNNGAQFDLNNVIYDFGSSKTPDSPDISGVPNLEYSVMDQYTQVVPNSYMPDYKPIIRDWKNVLTSWHQKGAVDYDMDADRFGKCESPIRNNEYPTTGNCVKGGRTGYSVKNISMDYLLSSDHALGGGASGAAGAILNPPPADF